MRAVRGAATLPSRAALFTVAAALLSLAFRGGGWWLSPSADAIDASHDWNYHAFWLPLHLLLARYAALVFRRNAEAGLAFSRAPLRPALQRHADLLCSARGLLVSVLLVLPFVVLDARAGADFVSDHAGEQGPAASLVPLIWLVEWLATGQIWLYVLGCIVFNHQVLSPANVRGRHEDILVRGQAREPLVCGLENAAITLVYGLSTVGYVWYADGQLSDYLVMAISTVLMLVCFFSALLKLRASLADSLDRAFDGFRAQSPPVPADAEPLPASDFRDAVGLVFERKLAKGGKTEERSRRIRLATVLDAPPGSRTLPRERYAQALQLLECEARLAEFGMSEMKAVSVRAAMPVFMIVGKSLGSLVGAH